MASIIQLLFWGAFGGIASAFLFVQFALVVNDFKNQKRNF